MRIFISYHTPDLDKARAVEHGLGRRRPGVECYLAPRNNAAGAYWLPRLAEEIAGSDAVLFLAGARIGPWQELEYYEALRLSRAAAGRPRIVPVVIAGQAPGLPFFDQLHQIFAPDPAARDCLAAIEHALDEKGETQTSPAWQRFQPYKGLPSLQESDAAFFFGRETETAQILDLAARQPDRIVALLGDSGVGKSSLARAGVLAALRSQTWPATEGAWPPGLKDSRSFLPLVVRPGEAPLKELALAFAQLYRTESYEIDREARGWAENFADGAGLHDLLRVTRDNIAAAMAADPPKRFVLYLDQGEELYSVGNADTARRFSSLIAEAAGHEAFSVLLSLRSDYYTAYQNDADLFRASERVDILPLSREILTEIVRRPALSLGARFESDDMALRVAEATAREPGALPLLSDLMHDMWLNMQARGDGVLRWSDNPEIVDVGAPLRKRADAFLARPGSDEAAVRHLFTLRLSNVPEFGEAVRRRARRGECSAAEWALAETLANEEWRLLSLARSADDEPMAEVAHERLLRSWPQLSAWLAEEREFLVWRGPVEAAAESADAELLSGRRLAVARGWFERRADDLAPKVRAFIAASIDADDRRVAAERRRRRVIFSATAAGLVVALILAGLAGWQWRVAEAEKAEAQAQREAAQHNLDLATETANALIFDIAEKFRTAGVPTPVIKAILDRALELQSQLAAGGASSPKLLFSEASGLIEAADSYVALGDTGAALAAAQQAKKISQELLTGSPDDVDYRLKLAISEAKVGEVQQAQGDLAGALLSYRDSVAILKVLVAKDATNVLWQRNLSVGDNKIGDVLLLQNDLPGALAAYQDGLAVIKALTVKDPGETIWQSDLAISDGKVGEVLQAQGNLDPALASYRDSRAILTALVAKDPGNTDWRRNLSVSDERIGDVLVAQGDLAGALTQYRDELANIQPLAKSDPSNTDWQRFMSIVQEKIGDVLQAQDDLPGALAAYRDAFAIHKTLAAKDPGNMLWQRDLSVSDDKIGDLLMAQGDAAGALASYRDGLAIARALALKDPTNVEWQTDIVSSLYKVASAGDSPVANLTEALSILRRLDAAGTLPSSKKDWITAVETALEKAKAKPQ